MRRLGIKIQHWLQISGGPETDPLTMLLAVAAVLLAAATAALSADLLVRPPGAGATHDSDSQAQPVSWSTVPVQALLVATASFPPPTSTLMPTPAATPQPTPVATPTLTPYSPAVRIRIPTISVDRSIIEVPLAYDMRTRRWDRNYDILFRRGKEDLVGHYGGSAWPGQPGNTILVGHNYGVGVNAVFVRLGRLQAGQLVEVVNATGQTFKYHVTDVISLPWTKKNEQELLRHQPYLSVEGPERLTLVTCGGSTWAPFPTRVYVVAEPAH